MLRKKTAAFIKLSRIPFLLPGIIPFTAGLIIGYLKSGFFDSGLTILSYMGIALIMFSTYYSNEYFDYLGDIINKSYNKFSGGSRVLAEKHLSREMGLYSLFSSLIIFSILFTIYMVYYFTYRPIILYMAIIGLTAGISYTAPPFKWAYKGIGETIIGISYGWLTTVSGYYISTGMMDEIATLISLPSIFSVFAVIFINEFPDYDADIAVGKMNLVARYGVDKAAPIYPAVIIAAFISEVIACYAIAGYIGLIISMIPLILVAKLISNVLLKKSYHERILLEKICAYTLLLNIVLPIIILIAVIINQTAMI